MKHSISARIISCQVRIELNIMYCKPVYHVQRDSLVEFALTEFISTPWRSRHKIGLHLRVTTSWRSNISSLLSNMKTQACLPFSYRGALTFIRLQSPMTLGWLGSKQR